jgi:hypothetical protein
MDKPCQAKKKVDFSYILAYQPVTSIDKSLFTGYGILPGKSKDVLAQVISDRVSFLKGT